MMILANILMPAIAGIALGVIYFGGLWLTLRRLATSSQPALLALGSYFGRLVSCLAGFVLVALSAGLQGVLVCMAAFITTRMVMIRRWGRRELAVYQAEESS